MLRILRDKFLRLGRDEEGVAMVVTLAVFMFMYLVCMGVYAIGTAVKTRIHLQNACDAAAYSAAVVQADTLSRIATLNRAMAWTYIAMTRRQMDVITYRWLGETVRHWDDDKWRAISWASGSTAVCANPLHTGKKDHSFAIPEMPMIALYGTNGRSETTRKLIARHNGRFTNTHIGGDNSFYSSRSSGIGSILAQIHDDWENVIAMGAAIDTLKKDYKDKAKAAANAVLDANLSDIGGRDVSASAARCVDINPMGDYMEVLQNTAEEERRFLSYCGQSMKSAFGDSGEKWFMRNTFPNRGFRRRYDWGGRVLRAQWVWYSNQWHCKKYCVPPIPCTSCFHHPPHSRCSCFINGIFLTAKVYGDNAKSVSGYELYGGRIYRYKDIYETPNRYVARPNKLKKNYFNKDGTITVGVAVKNQNPWASVLGDAIKGIYSAFNIGGTLTWTPQYMVCFASAKAGYKETLNWQNKRQVETEDRRYRVDWQNENDWNLRQSDWDAVLIPVRRAQSTAEDGKWSDGNMNFLDAYANKLGADSTKMLAGGANLPVESEPGDVKAEWQIGSPNNPVDWNAMQKVMLH